mmetsp:Transcript_38834/g.103086  ORF Transcript_38834/g.103086 Transcript_38834/m.103086 type:complete len:294 (-) Transcript_38834:127-1008(-)
MVASCRHVPGCAFTPCSRHLRGFVTRTALRSHESLGAAVRPAWPPGKGTWTDSRSLARVLSCRQRGDGQALQDLWDRPLSKSSGRTAATDLQPRPSTFRKHFENDVHWRMNSIFGHPMQTTPPSARHIFLSCGLIESVFLVVNATTLSPFVFEMFMPYHLKYTGLVMAWWGGTYWGLEIAGFGRLSHAGWAASRLCVGVVFMTVGVAGIILADGLGNLGVWPSYWLLAGGYSVMPFLDMVYHKHGMLPPWLLRWKAGVSALIVISLLLGVLKGSYLERNSQRLIFEAKDDFVR